MQRRRLAIAAAFVAFVAWNPSSEAFGPRLTVRKYGFSVESPIGWRATRNEVGMPLYFNFQGVEMLGKGVLPKGGATINVVAWDDLRRRHGDGTVRGWAQVDAAVAIKETLSV